MATKLLLRRFPRRPSRRPTRRTRRSATWTPHLPENGWIGRAFLEDWFDPRKSLQYFRISGSMLVRWRLVRYMGRRIFVDSSMSHLRTFITRHNLDLKADHSVVSVPVEALYEANELAYNLISGVDPQDDKHGFVVQAHLNLLGRLFEQASGMLVCITTKSYTSAEALGRVVVEGAINFMYLSIHAHDKTLVAYIESWLNEHQRKLKEFIDNYSLVEAAAEAVSGMRQRHAAIELQRTVFEQMITDLRLDRVAPRDAWPKSLFQRFQGVNREHDYYTSYHRLSSASHLAAEDTLNWLLGIGLGNPKMLKNLAIEAVSYSVMMSRIAVTFFVDAAIFCCIGHHRLEVEPFSEIKLKLQESIAEVEVSAGVPKCI